MSLFYARQNVACFLLQATTWRIWQRDLVHTRCRPAWEMASIDVLSWPHSARPFYLGSTLTFSPMRFVTTHGCRSRFPRAGNGVIQQLTAYQASLYRIYDHHGAYHRLYKSSTGCLERTPLGETYSTAVSPGCPSARCLRPTDFIGGQRRSLIQCQDVPKAWRLSS